MRVNDEHTDFRGRERSKHSRTERRSRLQPRSSTPDELRERIAAEVARRSVMIRSLGIRLQPPRGRTPFAHEEESHV